MRGESGLDIGDLFQLAPKYGTRGHRFRLQRNHSRLDIRAQFFSNRVIPAWNKLPEQVVEATSVESFKKALDKCWIQTFPDYTH